MQWRCIWGTSVWNTAPLGLSDKEKKRKDCATYAVALYMRDKCVEHCPPGCVPVTPNHAAWSTCTGNHVLFWEDVLVITIQTIMQTM